MNVTRMHLNEMPYPPSQEIIQIAQESAVNLNRYSDIKAQELLKNLLADYSGVPVKHCMWYPGTDLLLRELVHIFSKKKFIMLNPTFFPTLRCAKQFASKLIQIPLDNPEFHLNHDLILNELNEPSIVIIDNPNNPTGKIVLDRNIVKSILENENTLLVVDEAYYEFTGLTFANMVGDYPNLAIVRTVSKAFGLAGARIGYLIGGEIFLEAFSTFFTFLPQPSLSAAIEGLKNPDYINENVERTVKERERVRKRLVDIGIQVFPSNTNFLLIKTKIGDIANKLRDKGVLILDLSDQWQNGFIRVSIGSYEENNVFLSIIEEVVQA